jgi:type IV pilus assembly protein PilM
MALPFLSSTTSKKRDQLLCVDLGGRTTKAVYLQRKDNALVLSRFALLDAPIYDKSWSVEMLTDHLKTVSQALELKTKQIAIAISPNEMVVRNIEMPFVPVYEMRQMLKLNTKAYLQQDLPGYVYDCFIVPPKQTAKGADKSKSENASKAKVLVAGTKKNLVDDLQVAIKGAGLIPSFIVPSLIGPVNAFEQAMPEVFEKEVLALVDIGFKNTTICLLQYGELILTRVVNIGGDKLTNGLAEMMNISYAEAEGIKVGMANEVQPQLEPLVSALGRELRASIDFFEHQQDKAVTHVYVSGGSARSEYIVQTIQGELAIECKTWNPASTLQLMLPAQQSSEIDQVAPQLTVAIGAALTAL